MPRKKKLPLWLVIVLAAVLAVLLIIVGIISLDRDESISTHKPQTESALTKPSREPSAGTISLPDPLTLPTIVDIIDESISTHKPQTESAPAKSSREPSAGTISLPDPLILPTIAPGKGIALVIDDVGYDLHALRRILDLSIPVAISILPGAPYASESASLAHQHGQTVMLHLPMEPLVPKYQKRMTDTFLRSDMSEEELRHVFSQNLKKIPYVEGVNNHMGSLLTQLEDPMRWVMQLCREKGLFFIDSKTSSTSVATKLAASMGIAWASRRYFLDHQLDEHSMGQAWNNAMACVERDLGCIVIAHPHEETISFLEKYLTKANMLPVKHLLKSAPLEPQQVQEGKPVEQLL